MIERAHFLKQLGIEVSHLDKKTLEILQNSKHLTTDSREVKPDSIFIAIRGEKTDGHAYLNDLPENCLAFIEKGHVKHIPKHIKTIRVKHTRNFANQFASFFYKHPSVDLSVLGITGTNGKTTTSYFVEAIQKALQKKVGVIGTIEIRYQDKIFPNPNTTPEPVKLQRHLFDMKHSGIDAVAMEVSSHGLALGRVQGIQLDGAVFTNITRDHLDLHQTMEQYLQAKLKIFDLVKKNGIAGFWAGTECVEEVIAAIKKRDLIAFSYGIGDASCFLNATIGRTSIHGFDLKLHLMNHLIYDGNFSHVGEYNLLNLLSAFSLCLPDIAEQAYGKRPTDLHAWQEVAQTSSFKSSIKHVMEQGINACVVPGRLEKIENQKGSLILVDYAHTPDALENALQCLADLPHRRLISVFGCGGDRDKTKRTPMGEISGRLADYSVITSDNPRTEDPQQILDMTEDGIKKTSSQYTVIKDRREAIEHAISQLEKNDILLVAGKGHEDYQIIGNEKIHFDDRKVIRELLFT